MSPTDTIFEPLAFRNLTIENRLLRSSLGALVDTYDGAGTDARINFEVRFARAGVGAIISCNAPVDVRGILAPGLAHIERDDRIPFWAELVRQVHAHGCPFIIQLGFSGRQREMADLLHYPEGLSSTTKPDWLRGMACRQMTRDEIEEIVYAFGQAARRAREAGADGVEIHGANGFIVTQFLSRAINTRTDEYGGSLENRARLALDIVREVRKQVGDDFHVQFKISPVERLKEVFPWGPDGNGLEDSIPVCKWLESAGVDAFHISTGAFFPNPRMPPGPMPIEELAQVWGLVSARHMLGTVLLRTPVKHLFSRFWARPARGREEGIILDDAHAVRQAVGVPVLCAGGFQTASTIGSAIERGLCDAVTVGRPLLANPELVRMFAAGLDRAPKPCTYCNKCLINFVRFPVGCFDERRFDSHEEMTRQVFELYEPEPVARDAVS
jgi:2,4-dienoyl-CoA reductase-like NADH-dependent reductase (Old Yellow Enzyme family)